MVCGEILDFVPNHMGVGVADNPLWLDVLEWGPDSPYAGWFDIDWQRNGDHFHDKLWCPFSEINTVWNCTAAS